MKFTVILAGLVGVALAQSGSSTENTASSTSTSLSPTQTCLAACSAGDVNCQAACLGNPFPNEAQVNATTECSMRCVQGNGTQEETEAYGRCLESCRASYFISSGTNFVGASQTAGASGSGSAPASGSATATGAASTGASGSATRSGATSTGSSGTASGSASGTASASAAASSGAAVSDLTVKVAPFAGVVALLMGALAL
ncbi:hypothetical protein CAC42_2858 [Sphaceloma murrayae]|uniref:Uncharacterized protein n=1 Tax=Sphaceloma murrayae TaxID=2082308 RepID=A0A2K1R0W4_9PEZI|nr:hypothetical protein CAC42_2858 [Sphaceloma murrayae]